MRDYEIGLVPGFIITTACSVATVQLRICFHPVKRLDCSHRPISARFATGLSMVTGLKNPATAQKGDSVFLIES